MPPSGKPWADGPFKLIPTPEFLQNSSDQYIKTASIMALSHNSILRALNSIYLQAPHVKAEDSKDFVGYCLCWHQVIENHHRAEEELFFPQIEALAGESGIMDLNSAQHHAFEEGLVTYATYLRSLAGHEGDFSSTRLIAIIDSFSATLHRHLADEITSLLDLRKYDGEDQGQSKNKFPLLELTEATFYKYGMSMNKTEGSMMFWLNLDVTFEDNRWVNWPPMPWLVRCILTRMFTLWNSGWWKFASCDLDGKPKELYAVE